MPVKDWADYPKDWKEIGRKIIAECGGRCECVGECGVESHSYFDGNDFIESIRCHESHKSVALNFRGKVFLAIAHLNQNTNDNRRENLKGVCQKCHNRIDKPHRIKHRREKSARDRENKGDITQGI